MNRREEIDLEIRQLLRLESRLIDIANIHEGIRTLIADLEAEKAELPSVDE